MNIELAQNIVHFWKANTISRFRKYRNLFQNLWGYEISQTHALPQKGLRFLPFSRKRSGTIFMNNLINFGRKNLEYF